MFSCNNAAFVVLGRIVEVLRGKPYDQCLHDHPATPLGLTHFATNADEAIAPRSGICRAGSLPRCGRWPAPTRRPARRRRCGHGTCWPSPACTSPAHRPGWDGAAQPGQSEGHAGAAGPPAAARADGHRLGARRTYSSEVADLTVTQDDDGGLWPAG
ncbi:serine hydrolase [Amycolatopsis thermalba]|uniref:serine hydrolase n=1 Tax=Amycolatopsis TaxID=1813 RepID=UPI003D2625A2